MRHKVKDILANIYNEYIEISCHNVKKDTLSLYTMRYKDTEVSLYARKYPLMILVLTELIWQQLLSILVHSSRTKNKHKLGNMITRAIRDET